MVPSFDELLIWLLVFIVIRFWQALKGDTDAQYGDDSSFGFLCGFMRGYFV